MARERGKIGLTRLSGGVPVLGETLGHANANRRKLLIIKCVHAGTQHPPSLFRHGASLLQHGASLRGMLPSG